MKKSDLLLLGALAVGGYLLYRYVKGAGGAVSSALTSAQTGTADVLYAMFGPAITAATGDYIATFPDGSRHAIPNNTVASDGSFTWTGYPVGSLPPVTYYLARDSAGNAYASATPISSAGTQVNFGLTNATSW